MSGMLADIRSIAPLHAASVQIDRGTGGRDIVALAFNEGQISGREPFVHYASFDQAVAADDMLPPDAIIKRSATTDSEVVAFACSPRGSLLISVAPRSARVVASAAEDALAGALIAEVRSRVPAVTDDRTVPIRTWYMGRFGSDSDDRRIAAPSLDVIASNYPRRVNVDLKRLFDIQRPTTTGKLILWHGDPGTGKTTAVRALLRQWRGWCVGQYIADPEQFFANPGYIISVLTRPPAPQHGPTLAEPGDPGSLWRLIIAEDCDEYLRASARRDAGAGLGRLLNLTDGILGQGFNTLVLLTTNEELSRLHPAITRPGRCLAKVEFTRFKPDEARRWLPPGVDPPETPATLAELYERQGRVSRIGPTYNEGVPVGAYL